MLLGKNYGLLVHLSLGTLLRPLHHAQAMASSNSQSNLRSFNVIVAATAGSLGIGKNGTLPWRLPADMAYFKQCTSTPSTATANSSGKVNAVIMGRKTWESIPGRFRPLQGRRNIVLSRNPRARKDLLLPQDVLLAGSLSEALTLLAGPPHSAEVDKVFVIGGSSLYTEAVASDLCEKVLMTSVRDESGRFDDCDVHFPALKPEAFRLVKEGQVQKEKGIEFSFDEYESILCPPAKASASSKDKVSSAGEASSVVSPAADYDNEDAAENGLDNSSGSTKVGSKRKPTEDPAVPREAALSIEATTAAPSQATGEEGEGEGEGNEEEMQYLRLVEDILDNGVRRGDRTGTGTLSKFGVQMRFSLREDRFPLLTTKRVFWRGVAEELLWFVSGCTNANVLKEKGVGIWDGNGSREFLDG